MRHRKPRRVARHIERIRSGFECVGDAEWGVGLWASGRIRLAIPIAERPSGQSRVRWYRECTQTERFRRIRAPILNHDWQVVGWVFRYGLSRHQVNQGRWIRHGEKHWRDRFQYTVVTDAGESLPEPADAWMWIAEEEQHGAISEETGDH